MNTNRETAAAVVRELFEARANAKGKAERRMGLSEAEMVELCIAAIERSSTRTVAS